MTVIEAHMVTCKPNYTMANHEDRLHMMLEHDRNLANDLTVKLSPCQCSCPG